MARRKKIRFRKNTPRRLIEWRARRRGALGGAALDCIAVASCQKCGAPLAQSVVDKYGKYCPICAQYEIS